MVSNDKFEILAEFDKHEVRYEEFFLDEAKHRKLLPVREYLPYGELPYVDCEIDDDCTTPDYTKYILQNPNHIQDIETTNTEEKKTDKKDTKQSREELSLDKIYTVLREMKIPAIRKIIKESKSELLKVKNNPPDKKYLNLTKQMFSVMFNPEQKLSIYMNVRETLNIPPRLIIGTKYLYTIVAPEAAFLIYKKKFKLNTKNNALNILTSLLLLDQSFFEKKTETDLHCRT